MNKYDGHTPGPWTISGPVGYEMEYEISSGPLVVGYLVNGSNEADARLIADAPTLLAQRDEAVALLREVRSRIGDGTYTDKRSQLAEPINTFLSRLDKELGDASD